MTTVVCFPNGNVAVFQNGKQVREAQIPWILEVAENLTDAGINPAECEVTLPDGNKARFFTTEIGLNWEIF